MASTSSGSSASPSTPGTSSWNSSDAYSPTEWTQHTMLSDLMEQKGLLIGLGVAIVVVWFLRSRSRPEEKAARRLVRDWRHVDDPEDVRDLLGDNLPTIVRPALLIALDEIERQVHRGFRKIEKDIERL
jgi:hypothetical protein